MQSSQTTPAFQLDKLYATLPKLECQGKCQESCGPVFMSRVEWERIKAKLGWIPKAKTITCPMLHPSTGNCRVYEVRPMLCRLWGIVESMPCLWGCKPDKYLSNEEGYKLLAQADATGS